MKQRIITAVIALCVFTPFVIFSDTFMMIIFSGVLSIVGIGEMLNCIGLLAKPAVSIPSFLVGAAAALLTRLMSAEQYIISMFAIYFIYMVIILTAAVFSHGGIGVTDAALSAMMTIYISFGFSSLVLLRDMKNGFCIYLLAIICPWLCDIFAYFTGVLFGRHKLIPDVSPKKTVEGAIGGTVCGTLLTFLYGLAAARFFVDGSANGLIFLIGGFVMCIISQCGDLIASVIKRHYGIKDYGNVFPGHGGVIDRFDSILPTSAALFLMLFAINAFELFV